MIAVFGEALIDLVPSGAPDQWVALPGGGPANTAIALARLGTPVALACRLSGDGFGDRLRRHLRDNGVDLRLAVRAAEPSSLAVLSFAEHGIADYRFYVQGTADWQWTPDELPGSPPAGTRALHFGTLAGVLPPGADVLLDWAAAQSTRTVISYDVNARPTLIADRDVYHDRIGAWLDLAHVVKASGDDLEWLYPGQDPLDVARDWLARRGQGLMLITQGAKGAVAVPSGGAPVHVDGVPVDVVDTVGAGDTFMAGVLHSLLACGALGTGAGTLTPDAVSGALRYGVAAAALSCTRANSTYRRQEPMRGCRTWNIPSTTRTFSSPPAAASA